MVVTRLSRALAAAAALLVASSLACARRGGEPFETVSIEEVERMLRDEDVVVIDANTPRIFRRAHLPGARHWRSAPIAEILPAEREARLVFYCASPS